MNDPDVLTTYRDRLAPVRSAGSVVDELLDGAGAIDAAVRGRLSTLDDLGLWSRGRTVRRLVEDDGITYGSIGDGGRGGAWHVDPLPVVLGTPTWSRLSDGLRQRAHLLDLVLADLYGPQRLLHDGTIPADVVLGHPEFLPDAVGAMGAAPQPLVLASTDLARAGDGTWTVLGDRAQAPSGAGYAMADRRLVARTFPRLYRNAELARLRVYFDRLGSALEPLCRSSDSDGPGRIVLLSPGTASETAFDQTLTASLLGVPVVQAEDLTVVSGQVWWHTGSGDQRVDVIVRRVDSTWSDPLEFRSDSQLGVAGLLEAVRSGAVTVVNPLGAGVLESPALAAFLPRVCRALLGEDLRLAGPRTWWCGDPEQAREALGRISSLVIKSASGETRTRLGWLMTRDELTQVRTRIEARPWDWVVQEPVAMSTVPVVTRDGLEPRRFVLRTFGVAVDGNYEFMPGGLGRVSEHVRSRSISSAAGGPAKDVWVPAALETGAAPARGLPVGARRPALTRATRRVADDLFWFGRYAERAESVVRLLLTVDDLLADYLDGPESPGQSVMKAMLQAVADLTGRDVVEPDGTDDLPMLTARLRPLVLDENTPGTVAFAIDRLVQDAHGAREMLPPDTWLVLSRLERAMSPEEEGPLRPVLVEALESLLALGGLAAEAMMRDSTWAFVESGRRIERSLQTIALLRRTVCDERAPVVDGQVTEAVLGVTDSLRTHHRRLAEGTGPAGPVPSAVDLLVSNSDNPRSVAFQLERLVAALDRMPVRSGLFETARRLIGEADAEALCVAQRAPLRRLLIDLDTDLRGGADLIERECFARPVPHRTMAGEDLLTGRGSPS